MAIANHGKRDLMLEVGQFGKKMESNIVPGQQQEDHMVGTMQGLRNGILKKIAGCSLRRSRQTTVRPVCEGQSLINASLLQING